MVKPDLSILAPSDYPAGYTLFAGPDDGETLDEAKVYCLQNGLTPDTARIIRADGMLIVKKK